MEFETNLYIPYVDTFIKRSTGEKLSVRWEGHAVNRLLMSRQCVYTWTTLHIPQSHRRVKGRAENH